MEKYIIKWSHRLGVLSLTLAFVARGIDLINPKLSLIPTGGERIGYLAFMHAAILFFIATIATTCYAWFELQHSPAASRTRESEIERASSKSIAQETA